MRTTGKLAGMLAAFLLAFGAAIWQAPIANAYVLHSRSNHIICSAWGGGAINLAVDYYSWTDSAGNIWVQMKGGNSIHIDTLNNTTFDPESFILKDVSTGSIYGETFDSWGNDSPGIYMFGGLAHDHALVATIDNPSGIGYINVATTYQGESMGWSDYTPYEGFLTPLLSSSSPGSFSSDPRIFFENETWLVADNATNSAWCSVKLLATS